MLYINKITNDPQQQITLTGIPGYNIIMTLRFLARMNMWIAGFSFNTTVINGIAVVTSANILRQFKNNIPFGISCLTTSGLDPHNITDFSSLASSLYLLDSSDVAALEADFFT